MHGNPQVRVGPLSKIGEPLYGFEVFKYLLVCPLWELLAIHLVYTLLLELEPCA